MHFSPGMGKSDVGNVVQGDITGGGNDSTGALAVATGIVDNASSHNNSACEEGYSNSVPTFSLYQ